MRGNEGGWEGRKCRDYVSRYRFGDKRELARASFLLVVERNAGILLKRVGM